MFEYFIINSDFRCFAAGLGYLQKADAIIE